MNHDLLAEMRRTLDARLTAVSPLTPPPVPDRDRSERSRRTCHRFSLYERPRSTSPRPSGAYVPELAAMLEDDRNLTDGARRCARKLAEYAYRRDREGRTAEITVTYLAKALGKC